MSRELPEQNDPLLDALLQSADADCPPSRAKDQVLESLGLGTAGVVLGLAAKSGTSQAPLASASTTTGVLGGATLKIVCALGIVGLGAAAWSTRPPALNPTLEEAGHEPPPMRAPLEPASLAADVQPDPAAAQATPRSAAAVFPHEPARVRLGPIAATTPAPSAPFAQAAKATEAVPGRGDILVLETQLLSAARTALSEGDKARARVYLMRYQQTIEHGALQPEADILWRRANSP